MRRSRVRTDRPAFAIEAGVLVLSTLCGCAVLISCAGAAPEPRSGSEAGSIVSSAEANETLDDADLALARGQTPAAERAYLSVLEARPEDPRALAGLTRVALADGDFEAALGYDDRVRTGGAEVPGQLGARERCALWLAAGAGRVESGAGPAWDLIDRIEADPACPRADLPGSEPGPSWSTLGPPTAGMSWKRPSWPVASPTRRILPCPTPTSLRRVGCSMPAVAETRSPGSASPSCGIPTP